VNRLGRLRDLAPVLHRASLAIAPLRVGSGLKIKLLDYARHGLLTVATPSSLEGFAADETAPFIAAGNHTGFALSVLNQVEAGAAPDDRALAYVTRHYGVAASFAGLGAALGLG
jgi:succinoglycan biosynthesis protein ExoO